MGGLFTFYRWLQRVTEGGQSMTPTERRQRLLEVLCIRRHDTCDNLAHEFHVANSTIRRDLEILTCSYPIETVRGRHGGGVKVAEGYYLYRKALAPKQAALLQRLRDQLDGEDRIVLNSILLQFTF